MKVKNKERDMKTYSVFAEASDGNPFEIVSGVDYATAQAYATEYAARNGAAAYIEEDK
jgi:hypothetical protein